MTPHHILVVDDDADIRETLIELIRDQGYDAIGAADGREALNRLRRGDTKPCLILLDLMMPKMDGWEFRQAQSTDPALADIPVVVISAYRNSHRGANLDAVDHLHKPVQMESLVELIHRHCPAPTESTPSLAD
ncbi:MAG TPA: response regulator [Nannocystaceae bacterium]|nr:response regulator [Nannocystaceae bacterium]